MTTQERYLEQIKLECLVCRDPSKALTRIIRLCINAGISKKLPELHRDTELNPDGVLGPVIK